MPKFWTAHEKGTDKAIVTIDASDDDLFHKTAKALGRPVNWRKSAEPQLSPEAKARMKQAITEELERVAQ